MGCKVLVREIFLTFWFLNIGSQKWRKMSYYLVTSNCFCFKDVRPKKFLINDPFYVNTDSLSDSNP